MGVFKPVDLTNDVIDAFYRLPYKRGFVFIEQGDIGF